MSVVSSSQPETPQDARVQDVRYAMLSVCLERGGGGGVVGVTDVYEA